MTLDELIALNDEIAALVRAGVPLEIGLAELGSDMPGRLGRYATQLGERMARGESLAEAIGSNLADLPAPYRAVVEAGVRAGRLPAALESMAAATRRLLDTYRVTAISFIYPLVVVLVAWCGLIFFCCEVAPRLIDTLVEFEVPGETLIDFLARAGENAWQWGPIVPAAMLLFVAVWWLVGTKGRRAEWLFARTPITSRIVRTMRMARFLEILALLVENRTPLPEAAVLAGDASGDACMAQASRHMAETLKGGQTRAVGVEKSLPPLVNWLLMVSGRENALLAALRHAAGAYHRRARQQADSLRMFLPIFLTMVIGGSVTAAYALLLFYPYTSMLHSLAR